MGYKRRLSVHHQFSFSFGPTVNVLLNLMMKPRFKVSYGFILSSDSPKKTHLDRISMQRTAAHIFLVHQPLSRDPVGNPGMAVTLCWWFLVAQVFSFPIAMKSYP